MDQLRSALRARHYSRRTEQAYCLWVRRYIRFHDYRHPAEMVEPEINAFLTHLAVDQNVERVDADPGALGAAVPLPQRHRLRDRRDSGARAGQARARDCPSC